MEDSINKFRVQAEQHANARSHKLVTPEHLLFSLLADEDVSRIIREVVNHPVMDPAGLYNMLVKHLDDLPSLVDHQRPGSVKPATADIVENILYNGHERSNDYYWLGHSSGRDVKEMPVSVGILLEILDRKESVAAKYLTAVGVNAEDIMSYIECGPKVPLNPKRGTPKLPKIFFPG